MDDDGEDGSAGDVIAFQQAHLVATGKTQDHALIEDIYATGLFAVTPADDGMVTVETCFPSREEVSAYDALNMALTGIIADRAVDAAVERHAVRIRDPDRTARAFATLDGTALFEHDDMAAIGETVRRLALAGFAFTLENQTEYEYTGLLGGFI